MPFPQDGHIDSEWLMSENRDDPWILVSTDPHNVAHKEPFIGNGLVGQRVPPEGEGSGMIPGRFELAPVSLGSIIPDDPEQDMRESSPYGCQAHGMWDDFGLMCLPNWSTLQYSDGNHWFSVDRGQVENYRQELNLKRGDVVTSCTWTTGVNEGREEKKSQISTVIRLLRHHSKIGLISITVIPDFSGVVIFKDALDGSVIEQGSRWHSEGNDMIQLSCEMGSPHSIKKKVFYGSRVSVDGGEIQRSRVHSRERSVERLIQIEVKKGVPFTVHKTVYIGLNESTPSKISAEYALRKAEASRERNIQLHHDTWKQLWQHRITDRNLLFGGDSRRG